jgi:hypothetical protein
MVGAWGDMQDAVGTAVKPDGHRKAHIRLLLMWWVPSLVANQCSALGGKLSDGLADTLEGEVRLDEQSFGQEDDAAQVKNFVSAVDVGCCRRGCFAAADGLLLRLQTFHGTMTPTSDGINSKEHDPTQAKPCWTHAAC